MADAGAKVLRGLLDVFILEALEREPKHGYALLREMATAFGTEPNRNRLYPLLGRMVQDGLIVERGLTRAVQQLRVWSAQQLPRVARRHRVIDQSADERDSSRRQRLLDAATELIGTQGYATTTVEQICADAKVSTRHFYQLFDNKESVFLAVYDGITTRSFQGALDVLEATEGQPITQRVPQALTAYVGPMVEDMRAARIAFVEIVGASPRVEERRLSYRESLVQLVCTVGGEAAARGEIRDRDFRFATLALTGAVNAIVYDWTLRQDREPVSQLEQAIADLGITLLTG